MDSFDAKVALKFRLQTASLPEYSWYYSVSTRSWRVHWLNISFTTLCISCIGDKMFLALFYSG